MHSIKLFEMKQITNHKSQIEMQLIDLQGLF